MSLSSNYIPTDEEFLDSLYSDPTKGRQWGITDPGFVASAAEDLQNAGVIPSGIEAEQFVQDLFNPRKDFHGPKIDLLRNEAEQYLSPDEQWLLSVPIGFSHTEELNGCAVLAPSGGKVILMDIGVILHMQMLARCVLAMTTWSSSTPFCRDHEPVAWVKTILSLAHYATSSEDRFLAEITTWHCPSLDKWDLKSAKVSTIIELFALLHEYGHVALGHLDSAKVAQKSGLTVFFTTHAHEFEADAFGFGRLGQGGTGDLAAVGTAILFRFLDLIEHLIHGASHATNTHPPAKERWLRIKQSPQLSNEGREAAGEVESLFDLVLDVAGKL